MAFSTAVKIGDLNDFIAPSQACVVSLQGTKAPEPSAEKQAAVKEGLQLNVRSSRCPAVVQQAAADGDAIASAAQQPAAAPQQNKPLGFQQTVVEEETNAVKVSLNDCLACSGCVTSAETVLLQHQSLKEFVARCGDPDVIVVVSVSPQSRASLAALHGLAPDQVQGRLSNFLKAQLSVALLLDTGLGAALALTEAAAEFVARYRQHRSPATAPTNGSHAAASAAATAAGPLPMLASSCPGWVCYAEKTHGSYVLPHIASSRSPQAIMGSLVKVLLAQQRGWDPSRIYHVTVMPCYDKKLEASRDDFLVPGSSVPEVDSCLTTGELQELLERYGCADLAALQDARPDNMLQLLQQGCQHQQQQHQEGTSARWPEPLMHVQPGSSGGYAQHIFAAAATALFGVQLQQQQQLPWKVLRNNDLQELQLLAPDGTPLLRFATAYGFRNIQTMVRKIKSGRCEYDYVEVMACPSGCVNGGGQIKLQQQQQQQYKDKDPGKTAAQLLDQLELLFAQQPAAPAAAASGCGGCHSSNGGCVHKPPQQQPQAGGFSVSPGVVQLLQQPAVQAVADDGSSWQSWAVPSCASPAAMAAVYDLLLAAPGGPGTAAALSLLHTDYHHREKTITSTISDW